MELQVKDVTKRYDRDVLREININMTKGVYGLLGPNGAGKSTLIRLICDIESPTAGQITYDGKPISQLGEKYREILGYVPQSIGYYPDFCVSEFMDYAAEIKGISKKEKKQKIRKALEQVNMEDTGKKKMKDFSGGMKQRIGIAQAILDEPQILILDEPTTGLDLDERMRFKQFITEYAQNHIVIFATHIVSDIEDIGSRILFLKDGAIRTQGSPSALLAVLKGKVWKCICSQDELAELRKKYKISNTKGSGSEVEIRFVADEMPMERAELVDGNLQDLYLYLYERGTKI